MRSAVFVCKAFLLIGLLVFAGCRNETKLPENRSGSERAVEQAVRISPDGLDGAEPAIASDPEGNLYVVYVGHNDRKSADVYLQKYDKGLTAVGERVRINPDAGTAKAWRGDPPTVAVGSSGSVYVGWTQGVESGGKSGNDLLLSVSSDGGKSFASPVKVNDDTKPASHGMHSLAVDKDGKVYFAWLDERNIEIKEHVENLGDTLNEVQPPSDLQFVKIHHNSNSAEKLKEPVKPEMEAAEPNSEVYFAVSADGGKTVSANKKIAGDVCPCCKTSLLSAADGTLYVSWRQVLPGDLRHIAVASTKDKGATFSEKTIVSDDKWKLNACPVSGAAMANGKGNSLKIFWYTAGDAGPAGIYFAESKDGGRSFGERTLLSSAASGTPVAFDEISDVSKCLFAVNDNRIKLGETGKSSSDTNGAIEDASLPAATMANGKIYAAFVRADGEKRSVWISPIR